MISVPLVVMQALDDNSLPPMARICMWRLMRYLDCHEFREIKALTLAHEAGCKDVTAGEMIRLLIAAGYLDEHPVRKPRALRLPVSRRVTLARAA